MPRHSQTQGSIERCNQDVEKMLFAWMRDNDSKQWTNGLNEVQYSKNARYHRGINRSPYRAMFSNYPALGVQSLRLDGEILDTIHDVDDLKQVLDQQIQSDDPNEQAIRLENMN